MYGDSTYSFNQLGISVHSERRREGVKVSVWGGRKRDGERKREGRRE